MVTPGHQRCARRGAERRHVEPVVLESTFGQPVERWGADRPAERSGIAEARVIGEDQQDVRGAFRRGSRRDVIPVRLRAVERPFHLPLKLWPPDRQLGAVDRLVAHVPLPPSRCTSGARAPSFARRGWQSPATLTSSDQGEWISPWFHPAWTI